MKKIFYPRYIIRKEIALNLIKKYVPKKSSFLEIGCGSGDIGITLAKKGYSGLMLDFSEYADKEIRSNLKGEKVPNLKFKKKDFLKFDSDKKYDFVILFEVLEHIQNDSKAIEKIKDFLKGEGVLFLSVPSRKCLWGSNDIYAGHVRRYEKSELIKLCNRSNFEILEFLSYGFPWLNFLKIFRDKSAKKKLENENKKSKEDLTKRSGLNKSANFIIGMISNKYTLTCQ